MRMYNNKFLYLYADRPAGRGFYSIKYVKTGYIVLFGLVDGRIF